MTAFSKALTGIEAAIGALPEVTLSILTQKGPTMRRGAVSESSVMIELEAVFRIVPQTNARNRTLTLIAAKVDANCDDDLLVELDASVALPPTIRSVSPAHAEDFASMLMSATPSTWTATARKQSITHMCITGVTVTVNSAVSVKSELGP